MQIDYCMLQNMQIIYYIILYVFSPKNERKVKKKLHAKSESSKKKRFFVKVGKKVSYFEVPRTLKPWDNLSTLSPALSALLDHNTDSQYKVRTKRSEEL